jgi:hypothetical protein
LRREEFQDPLSGLLGLDGAAGWGEVDVALMEILMIEHEGVLIVDGDVLLLLASAIIGGAVRILPEFLGRC